MNKSLYRFDVKPELSKHPQTIFYLFTIYLFTIFYQGSPFNKSWLYRIFKAKWKVYCRHCLLRFVNKLSFVIFFPWLIVYSFRSWASSSSNLYISLQVSIYKKIRYGKLYINAIAYCQLRVRRALPLFIDVPLRTRRVLSPQTLYSDNALLVLNGTSLDIDTDSALLALIWWFGIFICLETERTVSWN